MGRTQRTILAVLVTTVPLIAGVAPSDAARDQPSYLPFDDDPATLSGVVRGPGGTGVEGVHVVAGTLPTWTVWPPGALLDEEEDLANAVSTTTAPDGSYRLDLPGPAVYRIEFRPPLSGPASGLVGTFWGGSDLVEDALDVPVASAGTYPGYDVALETGRGEITGQVLGHAGEGLSSRILVMRDGTYVGDVRTASGDFRVPVDPGVPYQLVRDDIGHLRRTWFPGVTSPDQAEDVVVGRSGSADASFRVVSTADSTIAGRVTTTAGSPVEGVSVFPVGADSFAPATTDADGYYELRVAPGTYRVCATDRSEQYAGECWSHTQFALDSTPVTVARWGTVSGVDFSLPLAAHPSFRSTDGRGVAAVAYLWDERTRRWRAPGDREEAVSWAPAPGRYRFRIGPDSWWPSGSSIEEAQDVVLAPGEWREWVVPEPADTCSSSISGRVVDDHGESRWLRTYLIAVDDDGRPLPADDPSAWYTWGDWRVSYVDGESFTFTGVQPGRYRVRFGRIQNGVGDRAGWWPQRATLSEAGDLLIDGPGVQLSDVDSVVPASVFDHPEVRGTVVDDRGSPVPNAHVQLERFDDVTREWIYERQGTTGSTGRFAIAGRTGDYRIRIETPWQADLGTSWWTEGDGATPAVVRVPAGAHDTDVGPVAVRDDPATADPDSTPPPTRAPQPTVTPSRTECPPPAVVPTPDPAPDPAADPTPGSTPGPTPGPTTAAPNTTETRDGRLSIRSPRQDLVVVKNREAVRMRLVIGGRRITVPAKGRARLRFVRAHVRWHASWRGARVDDVRGRTRIR